MRERETESEREIHTDRKIKRKTERENNEQYQTEVPKLFPMKGQKSNLTEGRGPKVNVALYRTLYILKVKLPWFSSFMSQ